MFCFYPYTNLNQPNSGIASIICTCIYSTIDRGNILSIFLTDSK